LTFPFRVIPESNTVRRDGSRIDRLKRIIAPRDRLISTRVEDWPVPWSFPSLSRGRKAGTCNWVLYKCPIQGMMGAACWRTVCLFPGNPLLRHVRAVPVRARLQALVSARARGPHRPHHAGHHARWWRSHRIGKGLSVGSGLRRGSWGTDGTPVGFRHRALPGVRTAQDRQEHQSVQNDVSSHGTPGLAREGELSIASKR